MSDNAIYFPYIDVPQGQWLTRVLLYWDSLLSIVPYEYLNSPERHAPEMRELLTAGLVVPCIPGQYVGGNKDVADTFLAYVEERHSRLSPAHSLNREVPSTSVHIEKLDGIADGLVKLGLATYKNGPWYDLKPWVATAFMAYLATILGKQPGVDAAPLTHDRISYSLLVGRKSLPAERREDIRDVLLKGVFPRPSLPPTLESLVNFKDQYRYELRRLRIAVEEESIRIAAIDDDALRDEAASLAAERLEEEVGIVAEAMRIKWGKIFFGGVCSIVSASARVAAVDPHKTVLAFAAGAGLASAVHSALGAFTEHEKALKEPLAYAALVNSRFRPSRRLHDRRDP